MKRNLLSSAAVVAALFATVLAIALSSPATGPVSANTGQTTCVTWGSATSPTPNGVCIPIQCDLLCRGIDRP